MMNAKQKRSAISMVFKYTDERITFRNKLERDIFLRKFLKYINFRAFEENENTAGYGYTQRNALQVSRKFPQFKIWLNKELGLMNGNSNRN